MPTRVLAAGIADDALSSLRSRFSHVDFVDVKTGEEALHQLAVNAPRLLILDSSIASPDAASIVIRARIRLGLNTLPIIYVHDSLGSQEYLLESLERLGVRILAPGEEGTERVFEQVHAALSQTDISSEVEFPPPLPRRPTSAPAVFVPPVQSVPQSFKTGVSASSTQHVAEPHENPGSAPVVPSAQERSALQVGVGSVARISEPEGSSATDLEGTTVPRTDDQYLMVAHKSAESAVDTPSSTRAPDEPLQPYTPPIAPGAADPPALNEDPMAAIRGLWEQFKGVNEERVEAVQRAAAAAKLGPLDPDERRAAEREAHKLAGSVGTFGFMQGSVLAREIELVLQGTEPIASGEVDRLAALVADLRSELQIAPAVESSKEDSHVTSSGNAFLLIVDHDEETSHRIVSEAQSRNIRAEVVLSLGAARKVIARSRPDVVLLNLSFPGGSEDGLQLLTELHGGKPPVPTVVFTVRDTFIDRVQVAALGGCGFLKKSLPPGEVLDAIGRVLEQERAAESKVLAVDDDPLILATLRSVLDPQGIAVTTLEDPLHFWETLEQAAPDLLILDVDMPELTGIELCRVVRNDARWGALPILFLTARTDAVTVRKVFAAGADDVVNKPIIGPELIARIRNRMERTQLYRSMAETDPLTGVANRRKSSQLLGHFLSLAERNEQPLALCILDLDHFKSINDHFGHASGDAVLQQFARVLTNTFRSEDVIARWGGEEFLVGMYGMSRADGVQRMAEVLEDVRGQTFPGNPEEPIVLTFSGGVAQYPDDGTDLLSLYRAADDALYRAKESGRNRVLPVGWVGESTHTDAISMSTDVLLVDDDRKVGSQLLHAFETRGYRAHWLHRGEDAVAALTGTNPNMSAKVIMIDDDLPGMSGLKLLQNLRDAGITDQSQVIMLCARARGEDATELSRAGAFDSVMKPFTIAVAMQRVRRALEVR